MSLVNKHIISTIVLGLVISMCISSCNENSEGNYTVINDTSIIGVNKKIVAAENIIVYVPSPIETAGLLKEAGAKYNTILLNSPNNLSKYATLPALTLNLGVYGTDLAFASIFDQRADIVTYMNCTKKLANALTISSAFDASKNIRLERNMNNRDSVLSIITDAYWDCDALFQENNQPHASSLMVAGGWIEGLYLACKITENTNNNAIRVRIVEQRSSLDKLILLLEKQNHPDSQKIATELKKTKLLYDELPTPADKKIIVSTDNTASVTTIGDDNETENNKIDSIIIKKIINQVKITRNNIINDN